MEKQAQAAGQRIGALTCRVRRSALVVAHLCAALALGSAFGGCEAQDTYNPRDSGASSAGSAGVGGAGVGGSAQAGAGQGGGGAGLSGASNAGTGGSAQAGSGGSAMGGSAHGGGGSGGSSGTAGSAGNGAGGVSGGGAGQAGNSGSSGSAGTGGSSSAVHCTDHPIPIKSSWTVTASSADAGSPLVNATDGDVATRWSTGVSQNSDWLQVDFGVPTALDSITLALGSSPGDYPRAYQVRVSNSPQDNAIAPLAMGNGQQATDTVVTFATPALGRYLLISQVGAINGTWWSVAELTLACSH